MYDYIKGRLEELNPAQAVVEAGGFGYRILISLQTYSALESKLGGEVKYCISGVVTFYNRKIVPINPRGSPR